MLFFVQPTSPLQSVSIEYILTKLSESKFIANYSTISRHMKFFEALDLLIVVHKTAKGYLLKKSIEDEDMEVINHGFKKTQ